jgi:hypothetical protein
MSDVARRRLRSFPRKREPSDKTLDLAMVALGPRFRGDERSIQRNRDTL